VAECAYIWLKTLPRIMISWWHWKVWLDNNNTYNIPLLWPYFWKMIFYNALLSPKSLHTGVHPLHTTSFINLPICKWKKYMLFHVLRINAKMNDLKLLRSMHKHYYREQFMSSLMICQQKVPDSFCLCLNPSNIIIIIIVLKRFKFQITWLQFQLDYISWFDYVPILMLGDLNATNSSRNI